MIDFKSSVGELLANAIKELDFDEIVKNVEVPKNTEMGDFAFPCFKLASIYKKSPNMIAKEIVEKIEGNENFEEIIVAGPYINFKINKNILSKMIIEEVLDKKERFGSSKTGEGKNVIVEYSSVNIAKPFHMGHIRSTMIGYSLYKIYKFIGYNTTGINHLGDYGTQFGKLIVAYKLWGNEKAIELNPIPELLKIYVKFHEEAEKDPELDNQARVWFTKLEGKDEEATKLWTWFKKVSLKEFERVYEMLGVHFDSFAGESFYSDMMPDLLNEMREKNIMSDDDGAEIVKLEEYDMPNALITKSDGSSLYITRDLTAAKYRKNEYDFYKNIYVVGSQQNLHFKQWIKIIDLMGYDWAYDCVHVGFGMVALEEGSLSTRSGRVIFLEDVLNKAVEKTKDIINEKNPDLENKDEIARQVGVGSVVFQELSNNRIKDYTFSWEETLSFEGETGPYVQYSHARACSVLRNANVKLENIDYSLLNDKYSFDLIREISKFNGVIEKAAIKYEPSLVTRYITHLAQLFNRFYHENPILVGDMELRKSRVALVNAFKHVVKNGLSLIALEAPEKM
ncbi:MAG: arginine--tRNA ligase [Bacillota bacterium]|nr:arginine--tRNA ligase [Bacillota bacterium]